MYFKDEDKMNKGKVFQVKVRSLLDRLGMNFTDEGFTLLVKAFCANENEFDYLLLFVDYIFLIVIS